MDNINRSAIICNQVCDLYRDLLNSYVSDFYIEDHWNSKLSDTWRNFLETLSFEEVANLLDYDNKTIQKENTTPLTFLCLRKILKHFSVSRKNIELAVDLQTNSDFTKIFWKGVKLKKRHEIEIMARMCHELAVQTNCFNIVDIGSGLGHLSRLLAFKYGFHICTFEANGVLVKQALELDHHFEKLLSLKRITHLKRKLPVHINKKIECSISCDDFERIVRNALGNFDDNFKFGVVGLHPCGNLGSTLLRLYSQCSTASFISMASCCYMKLSLEPTTLSGFPLSSFYLQHQYSIDYLLCETACHAIENYVKKIRMKNHHYLKIHSLRAALEIMLVKINKKFQHIAVGNVKYEEGMSLREYSIKATKNQNVIFSDNDIEFYGKLIESTWINVVKFYSVRLFLAPLIESVILYDRVMYLREHNSICKISPAFDCQISPRNHVLSAVKDK